MSKKAKAKKRGSQADGTRRSMFSFDPHDIVIIGLDTNDGPEHPLYDAESNAYQAEQDEAMIANVRHFGILKPFLFERDGDRVIAVDGRSRVRWARCAAKLQKAAGEEVLTVPGIPKRGDAATLYGVSRAANRHRPDDSPLANAKQAQRLLDMGRSEAEVAIVFGVARKTLTQWLALLGLAPQVQAAVDRGLAVSAAMTLVRYPKSEQAKMLAQLTANGHKPTAREATNKVREVNGKAPVESPAAKLKQIQKILHNLDSERSLTTSQALELIRGVFRAPTVAAFDIARAPTVGESMG